MLVQRINWLYPGHEPGAEFYINMAEKYPKSFDEVWVTTLTGFPSLSKHEECAKWFQKFAKELQKKGKKVSLQLANSIGHGDFIGLEYDCSALADNPEVQRLVGDDGTIAKYSWCWNGKAFREYTYQEVATYAKIVQPDKFWIDDDFRAANHAPVNFGCFCPDCIRTFNELHGANFDRESLLNAIFDEDLTWRERWIAFIKDGLKTFMRGLCEAVHSVSPETEFGFQNGANGAYTGYGHKYLFDEMKAVSGKNPHFRAGGGFYDDHNPNLVLAKGVQIAYQHSFLPYYGVLSPEIECTPNTAYGKTVAGILLETSHYLALGGHDMTYNAMDDIWDPFEWHEKKFQAFEKMRPYWEKLGQVSKETKADGLRYVVSKKAYNKPLKKSDGIKMLTEEYYLCAYELLRDGFPIVYDETEGGVCLLHPNIAAILSPEEVENLKKCKVITCGESIRILNERGFDVCFDATIIPHNEQEAIHEVYEKNALNGTIKDKFVESHYTGGRFVSHSLSNLPDDTMVLGRYKHNFSEENVLNQSVATAIIRMPEGGKWAVFGYSLWKVIKTISERERILNVYDFLSDKAPARILSTEQAALNIRRDEEGLVRAVSLTNCSIAVQENLEVFIKKPFAKEAVFWGQYEPKQDLIVKEVNDGVIVTIPKLSPWSVGTVFFE